MDSGPLKSCNIHIAPVKNSPVAIAVRFSPLFRAIAGWISYCNRLISTSADKLSRPLERRSSRSP